MECTEVARSIIILYVNQQTWPLHKSDPIYLRKYNYDAISIATWSQFNVLHTQAEQALSTLDPEEQVEQVTELAQRLVQVTEPLSNKSLLPNDLGTSARIVADVITVLENSNSTNEV